MNLKKTVAFIDNHLLLGLSLFLLIFIPLYPKWPLFDIIPGYNVRVRLEDFFVLGAVIVWGIYVLRGKVKLREIPLSKPIGIYLLIGFLSTLSAIFITKTVPLESYHVMKLYLHFFRRIEYFSLFFIFYSSIYKKEQFKIYLTTLITAILGVSIYGFGQKYLYWPAYSTMNREFSKGIVLYLTEHARVLSTFGGHYDLAAYVMLTMTLLIPLAFVVKNKLLSYGLLFLCLAQYWLLILTASRTSFLGYLAGITIAFVFVAFKKGWKWSGRRWFAVMFVSMGIMLTLGPMSERFEHVLKLQDLRGKLNNAFGPPPENGFAMRDDMSLEEQLDIIASKSDAPPSPVKPTKDRPDDVYYDPYIQDATGSAQEATASAGPSYSENAMKYGLSAAIRMDALWPRAIAALRQTLFWEPDTRPWLKQGYGNRLLLSQQIMII
jgi:hypothetical protein